MMPSDASKFHIDKETSGQKVTDIINFGGCSASVIGSGGHVTINDQSEARTDDPNEQKKSLVAKCADSWLLSCF